MLDKRNDK